MSEKLFVPILLMFVMSGCQSLERTRSDSNPPTPSEKPAPRAGGSAAPPVEPTVNASVDVAGLGSCRPSADLSAALSRFVDAADADGDGNVSRSEAQSALNFLVGGMFFRADGNSDGNVTPEEGRAVRDELMSRHPELASLLAGARDATGEKPLQELARVFFINYGDTLSVEEARKSAGKGLDYLFEVADSNKDGKIARPEAVAAGWRAARQAGHAIFSAADENHDKSLGIAEFKRVIDQSAEAVFKVTDTNNDGLLSEDEAARAMNGLAQRVGLPQPTHID